VRYWMYDKKGRGDSGPMSVALTKDLAKDNARPEIGAAMRVGSIIARSYQAQDWWQTTPVAEIIKDTPKEVVFKTRSGSEYTWRILD